MWSSSAGSSSRRICRSVFFGLFLGLLRAGHCLGSPGVGRQHGRSVFGAAHDPDADNVSAATADSYTNPTREPLPPAVLLAAGLPPGQQDRQPAALAGLAQGQGLLPRAGQSLRVQAWRKAHPGYWRKRRKKSGALQDHCLPQALVPPADKGTLDAGRVTRCHASRKALP